MVKRFRASFLRANVRGGADATEKMQKTDDATHSVTQKNHAKQSQIQNHKERI